MGCPAPLEEEGTGLLLDVGLLEVLFIKPLKEFFAITILIEYAHQHDFYQFQIF
jgi:hypothetical protein